MATALYLALIIISIAVIGVVLLQGKGGGLGNAFGSDSLYGTRRGVEKTLFNITIGLLIAFLVLDLAAVLFGQ